MTRRSEFVKGKQAWGIWKSITEMLTSYSNFVWWLWQFFVGKQFHHFPSANNYSCDWNFMRFMDQIRRREGLKLIVIKMKSFLYGGFLKWWYQTAIGFPTKNDHFEVFWG